MKKTMLIGRKLQNCYISTISESELVLLAKFVYGKEGIWFWIFLFWSRYLG